jgi:hypothetical protein
MWEDCEHIFEDGWNICMSLNILKNVIYGNFSSCVRFRKQVSDVGCKLLTLALLRIWSLLGWDTVAFGEWFPTIWRIVLPSPSTARQSSKFCQAAWLLKMSAPLSSETLGTSHQVTQRYIPEYFNLHIKGYSLIVTANILFFNVIYKYLYERTLRLWGSICCWTGK